MGKRKITNYSELNKMIDEGLLSLGKMGEAFGVTNEAIRQYLGRTNQHKKWKDKRKENEERYEEIIRTLAFQLRNFVWKKAEEEGFAAEKAVEYYFLRKYEKISHIPFYKLLRLFDAYKKAQENEEAVGLKKLAEMSGFRTGSSISRILPKVNLEPFYGKGTRNLVDRVVKERIKMCFCSDLSCADISYFSGIAPWVIDRVFKKIGKSGQKKLFYGKLNYRLASQIYEAQDLGFKADDITDLVNLNQKAVNYAITNRKKIEREIMRVLRVFYSQKEIDKLYLEERVNNQVNC